MVVTATGNKMVILGGDLNTGYTRTMTFFNKWTDENIQEFRWIKPTDNTFMDTTILDYFLSTTDLDTPHSGGH